MQTPILVYDNRLNDNGAAISATSTEVNYDVMNLKDLRTYTYWKAMAITTQNVTVNCVSAKAADCLAIFGHNFNTIQATISLECSSDNFAADVTVAVAGFIPTSNKSIVKIFTALTKQYWRLKMTGMTAAPQTAILMIGQKLQFPYPPETPYSPYKEGIEGKSAKNKNGQILGVAIAYNPIEINARFGNLTRSFVFNTFNPVWDSHLKKLKPFFYVWDIDTYPDHVFFVKVRDGHQFQPALTTGSLVDEINLSMEGVSE